MSQNEAAALLGLTPTEYTKMETGKNDELTENHLASIYNGLEPLPTTAELCEIARRRSGLSLATLQAEVGGISKPTFHKLERAAHPDIVDIWLRRGYIFPKESA